MSSDWSAIRAVVLKRDNIKCFECGKDLARDGAHVHHVMLAPAAGAMSLRTSSASARSAMHPFIRTSKDVWPGGCWSGRRRRSRPGLTAKGSLLAPPSTLGLHSGFLGSPPSAPRRWMSSRRPSYVSRCCWSVPPPSGRALRFSCSPPAPRVMRSYRSAEGAHVR